MNSESAKQGKEQSRRPARSGSRTDLALTEKDRKILALVQEYRFLTMDLIWRLLRDGGPGPLEYTVGKDGKKRPNSYGFGTQALYKRLNLLSKGGFLVPHRLTDRAYGGADGSPRQVYHLGSAAVAPVAEFTGTTSDEIRQIVEANKKVKVPFMRHALEIATFKAALILATQESDGNVKLTFWEQGSQLRDYAEAVTDDGDTERYSVYPDAFFGLWVAGEGKGHANYFLEVDRGTMPIVATHGKPDIRKKVLGFAAYKASKRHSHRYFVQLDSEQIVSGLIVNQNSSHEPEQHASLKSIKGFTVLFLMPGSLDHNEVPTGRLANVLTAIPTFGVAASTSSNYWFAPFNAINLDEPQSVFGRCWVTPNPTKGLMSLTGQDSNLSHRPERIPLSP